MVFGRVDEEISPIVQRVNDWGAAAVSVTYLLFAPLASMGDLAGPHIRSSGLLGFGDSIRNLMSRYTVQENKRAAKVLGATGADMLNALQAGMGHHTIHSKKARRFMDMFFHATGLNWFTAMTRWFAAGMGRDAIANYITNTISPDPELRSKAFEYLTALGITRSMLSKDKTLLPWAQQALLGEIAIEKMPEPVKLGMATFIRESVMRPNPFTRPVYASNPNFMLVYLLKHFFYDYFFRVVRPTLGEIDTRFGDGDYKGGVSLSLTSLGAVMGLTMLGLEVRELVKFGARSVLPGMGEGTTALVTDGMPWPEYLYDIVLRSGVAGPPTILLEALNVGDPAGISPIGSLGKSILEGDPDLPILNSL